MRKEPSANSAREDFVLAATVKDAELEETFNKDLMSEQVKLVPVNPRASVGLASLLHGEDERVYGTGLGREAATVSDRHGPRYVGALNE